MTVRDSSCYLGADLFFRSTEVAQLSVNYQTLVVSTVTHLVTITCLISPAYSQPSFCYLNSLAHFLLALVWSMISSVFLPVFLCMTRPG